jgi:tetratricopeptide (TPR) repeat protein
LGKFTESIDCYDQAINLNPNHVNAYLNKGISHYNQNKLDESILCYSQAIKLKPNYAIA